MLGRRLCEYATGTGGTVSSQTALWRSYPMRGVGMRLEDWAVLQGEAQRGTPLREPQPEGLVLPRVERLLVHDRRLNDFARVKHAPRDGIDRTPLCHVGKHLHSAHACFRFCMLHVVSMLASIPGSATVHRLRSCGSSTGCALHGDGRTSPRTFIAMYEYSQLCGRMSSKRASPT